MTVGELLRSQRRWGRTRARKFLSSLALNENRRLGRLTDRQRNMLAAELRRNRAPVPGPGGLANLEREPGATTKGRVGAQAATAKTAAAIARATGSQRGEEKAAPSTTRPTGPGEQRVWER